MRKGCQTERRPSSFRAFDTCQRLPKVPEPAAEPPPQIMEGIVIGPLRKSDGNGHDEPVRLEDWRNLK